MKRIQETKGLSRHGRIAKVSKTTEIKRIRVPRKAWPHQ